MTDETGHGARTEDSEPYTLLASVSTALPSYLYLKITHQVSYLLLKKYF